MAITFAKWQRSGDDTRSFLRAVIDGTEYTVPADPGNRHYRELYEAVNNNEVTIEEADPAPVAGPPELSPRQFEWLLAYSGLEDVWGAVQDGAKANGNKKLYADLRAQERAQSYQLQQTLDFKNTPAVQSVITQVAPNADLSDATLTTLWHDAANQTFDTIG